MLPTVYKKWNPPVENRISDVHGWLQDMQTAKEFVEKLRVMFDNESDDSVVIDALATAALIRYSRCFTTGVRERLRIEKLETATPSEVDLHNRLRGARDRHVAHPVNLQEVHALYLIVDPSAVDSSGVVGLSSFSNVDLALSPTDIDATECLCEKWIAWLTPQLVAENEKIRLLAQQLTKEQVLALPSDEPDPVADVNAKRPQRKFQ